MVNEENISKREAQMHNIQAAIRITGAVKSTLAHRRVRKRGSN